MIRAIRQRKCKTCRNRFTPRNSLHVVCSLKCSVEHARKEEASQLRKAKREGRERLRTRSDYLKRAQVAFNAFIRLRDAGKPCICCGKPLSDGGLTGGGYDCGHYRSVGSAPHLRFVDDNAHAQRKQCNQWGSGRAVDYRIGLIARIGIERVEALESDQEPRKYTIDQLKEIERTYKAKLKELKQREAA